MVWSWVKAVLRPPYHLGRRVARSFACRVRLFFFRDLYVQVDSLNTKIDRANAEMLNQCGETERLLLTLVRLMEAQRLGVEGRSKIAVPPPSSHRAAA